MSIVEHIDGWNNNKLMRITYEPDGQNKVIKTHGISLYSAIKNVCENGGFSIEKYYQYLELMYKNK